MREEREQALTEGKYIEELHREQPARGSRTEDEGGAGSG